MFFFFFAFLIDQWSMKRKCLYICISLFLPPSLPHSLCLTICLSLPSLIAIMCHAGFATPPFVYSLVTAFISASLRSLVRCHMKGCSSNTHAGCSTWRALEQSVQLACLWSRSLSNELIFLSGNNGSKLLLCGPNSSTRDSQTRANL